MRSLSKRRDAFGSVAVNDVPSRRETRAGLNTSKTILHQLTVEGCGEFNIQVELTVGDVITRLNLA